jgi:dolichyl-phosphate beta-glucosyltransferase
VTRLSVIIPAFNEAARLPSTLAALSEYLSAHQPDSELVLVDDGSTDTTRALIEDAARRDRRVVPVIRAANGGKGAAVRDGVRRASGAIVLFLDADLAYPLEAIDHALGRIDAGADVALGARDLAEKGRRRVHSPLRGMATAVFSGIVERMLHLGIPDTQCGFKAFRADAARKLFDAVTVDGFAFDVELLFLAHRWGLEIARFPIVMNPAQGSSVSLAHDGPSMLRDLWRIRRNARRGVYDPPAADPPAARGAGA